jgi:hypothetical protein
VGGSSANLTLPDYGRVARHPGAIAITSHKPACHFQSEKLADVSRVATSTLRRGAFHVFHEGGFEIERYSGRTAIRSIFYQSATITTGQNHLGRVRVGLFGWSLVLKNWECRAKKSFGVEYGDWIEAHGAQRRDITGGKRETSKYKRDASERG